MPLAQMETLREILGRSGASLRILHIEHVTSCDRELLGTLTHLNNVHVSP